MDTVKALQFGSYGTKLPECYHSPKIRGWSELSQRSGLCSCTATSLHQACSLNWGVRADLRSLVSPRLTMLGFRVGKDADPTNLTPMGHRLTERQPASERK